MTWQGRIAAARQKAIELSNVEELLEHHCLLAIGENGSTWNPQLAMDLIGLARELTAKKHFRQSRRICQLTMHFLSWANNAEAEMYVQELSEIFRQSTYTEADSLNPSTPNQFHQIETATQIPEDMLQPSRLISQDDYDFTPGAIVNLSKFVLEETEIERLKLLTGGEISRLGARVFSLMASELLTSKLKFLTEHEMVIGWLLLEYEGIIIDSSLPENIDLDSLAAMTLSTYMCTEHVMRYLQRELNHTLLKTTTGHSIISDFSGSLLLVLTHGTTDSIAVQLLETILSSS